MVNGTKKATKDPINTKELSVNRQLPSLKTLVWSLRPSTGIGMEMPAERQGEESAFVVQFSRQKLWKTKKQGDKETQ